MAGDKRLPGAATAAGIEAPPVQRCFQPGPQQQRIGNYVGLAQKAGKLAAGDAAVEKALKAGKASLLLLAEDTAAAVKEDLSSLAARRKLPVLMWPDKVSLGLLAGKSRRGALAVLDAGFARAILNLCNKYN